MSFLPGGGQPVALSYAELDGLDRGIADTVRAVTKGDPNALIDKKGIGRIVDKILDDGKITENEATALTQIVLEGNLSDAARNYLGVKLAISIEDGALLRGGKLLVGETALADVYAALRMGIVGNINFTSPGTNLTYTPIYYAAIAELIRKGEIRVYEVKSGGLIKLLGMDEGASYNSDFNRLVLYTETLTFVVTKMMTIVHECTHAIQDWRDVVGVTNKYTEADAYVAGAVAARSLSNAVLSGTGKYQTAANKAAPLVVKGTANLNNQEWKTVYGDLVKDVERDPLYARDKDKVYRSTVKGEASEKDRMNAILNVLLEKMQRMGQFVDDLGTSVRDTSDAARKGLRDSLP
jgi:hypothetical protein